MPQLLAPNEPYGLPQVELPMMRTSTSMPRRPLMMASLAEQVSALVSTKTRLRLSVGSAASVLHTNVAGSGTQARSKNGVDSLRADCLSLNADPSNVLLAVRVAPAIM